MLAFMFVIIFIKQSFNIDLKGGAANQMDIKLYKMDIKAN